MKKANSIAVVMVVFLMVWGSAYGGEKSFMDFDGNDWLQVSEFSESWKFGFLRGFVTGIYGILNARDLYNRAVDGFPKEVYFVDVKTKEKVKLHVQAFKLPEGNFELYDITGEQLYDSLQTFYEDSRNRNIELVNAIYIVRGKIRGEDPAYIKALTGWLRKPRGEREKLIVDWRDKALRERRLEPYPATYKAKNGKDHRLFDYAR